MSNSVILNPVLRELLAGAVAVEATPAEISAMLSNEQVRSAYEQALSQLGGSVRFTMAGPVYTIPMLTPEFCDEIVRRARGYSYEVNEAEGLAYQIDEAVLQEKDPELYDQLAELLPVLNVWSLLVYQRPVTRVSSFQIARYTPEGTNQTGFHHDKTSDITAVISLNPGEFEGGGTEIRVRPDMAELVPPLPKGSALFFNGKMIHHRGAQVTSGERYLLVCWLESEI